MSSPIQYGATVVLILLLAFLAVRVMRKSTPKDDDSAVHQGPSLLLVTAFALVTSSAFMIWFHYAPDQKINPHVGLVVFLIIDAIAIATFATWSRTAGWGTRHVVAAATGAVLTYGWFGLWRLVVNGNTAMGVKAESIDIVGQLCLLVAMLGVCWLTHKRQTKAMVELQ